MAEMIVDMDGRLRFATNNSAAIKGQLISGKETLVPPCKLKVFVEARSLHLPAKAERGVTALELTAEIMVFIERWADVPEEWLEPLAIYVLMTWVFDRFSAIPYLRFLGEYATGKTRMLQVVVVLCYRSLAVSGNITGAACFVRLISFAERWR